MKTDSPITSTRMFSRVKPSVFRMPISETRSRTLMAMVLAETSMTVSVSAPHTASRNNLTLPRKEMMPSWKLCSLSVRVCVSELRNISSTARAMGATDAGLSAMSRYISEKL